MTFCENQKYTDTIGRKWYVMQIVVTPKWERLLLLKRERVVTNLWAIAVDNDDGTATILEKTGYLTLYSEEDK